MDVSNEIVEVWSNNFLEEFGKMKGMAKFYSFVGFDCEFGGSPLFPFGEFRRGSDVAWTRYLANTQCTKLLQVGIVFMNNDGTFPSTPHAWQFNLHFVHEESMCDEGSIAFLRRDGKMDIEKLETDGIKMEVFLKHMINSELFCNPKFTFVTYQGGIDLLYIAYMFYDHLPLEIRAGDDNYEVRRTMLAYIFPSAVDVKCILRGDTTFAAIGLGAAAINYGLYNPEKETSTVTHQSGHDAKLTLKLFVKLMAIRMPGRPLLDVRKKIAKVKDYHGWIYGMGNLYSDDEDPTDDDWRNRQARNEQVAYGHPGFHHQYNVPNKPPDSPVSRIASERR